MTTDHKPARAILALIALATDLPMPTGIWLYPPGEVSDEPTLAISFATVADGLAWATHLGVSVTPYVGDDGNRYLGHRSADRWHGWRLSLGAHDPATVAEQDTLSADESAALVALAA